MWTSPRPINRPVIRLTALLIATCTLPACALDAPRELTREPAASTAPPAASSAAITDATNNTYRRDYLQGNATHGWQPGQVGKPQEFWNRRINDLPVNPESAAVTRYLAHVSRKDKADPTTEFFGQFDLGKKAKGENYSHHVLEADANTPRYDFTPRLTRNGFPVDEFYSPHCDQIAMPVPPNGRLQGEAGYRCTGDGDCHLYVVDKASGRLYEQWRADNPGPDKRAYAGGCTNVWDLSQVQEKNLRGLACTSANAAGIPYIPLLVTPGEIKAGVIRHALAFTLPNGWGERDTYARPATHNPLRSSGWGEAEAAPGQPMRYGSHFRLRQDLRISPYWPPSLRVILQALKDYGMYHIDGGPRMIITSNDAFSEHHWDDPDIALNPFDMTQTAKLSWEDFELVSNPNEVGRMGRRDCQRRPVVETERTLRRRARAGGG